MEVFSCLFIRKIISVASKLFKYCIFLGYKGFDLFIKPWWISIIAYYCFVQYKITKYIVNIFIRKCFLSVKSINRSSGKFNIYIFVMPDLLILLWKIINLKVKFCIHYLMVTVGCKDG